jgi:flagellar hook protein FlgE
LIKYGWRAHFQNSKGYFTTGWTTFAIDYEFKIDNKLFTITSPSNIIVKVLGTIEAVLNANDKVDEDDFENDTKEEDIVDDEDYEEKDEDDVDDKVVKLASMNEEHSYQDDDSMVLISFNEDEDDEELPKSQTPWLHEHIN